MSTAKPLSRMLNHADDHITALYQHCRLLQTVAKLVQQCLPADLTEHCQVVNLSNNHLILRTDSPAWNTLLRYQIPELLAQLRQQPDLQQLKSIRVKTTPVSPPAPSRDDTQARHINPDATALLISLASSISDPGLSSALQRLARHNRQP